MAFYEVTHPAVLQALQEREERYPYTDEAEEAEELLEGWEAVLVAALSYRP